MRASDVNSLVVSSVEWSLEETPMYMANVRTGAMSCGTFPLHIVRNINDYSLEMVSRGETLRTYRNRDRRQGTEACCSIELIDTGSTQETRYP
jgi:hypothetical protein